MTLYSRSFTRASAVTLAALTFAACSDATSPIDVSPELLEVIGESMAAEIQTGVLQLTATDAMGTVDAPAFSVQRRPANFGGAAFNLQRAAGYPISFQTVDTECGVPSQNPPTDSDADEVPDNLTITFALPACRFVDTNGSFELTGLLRVSDPTPGTAGMAFNMSLDNFRLTFSMPEGSGYFRQDGLTSVNATATGLSQTVDWLQSAQVSGYPGIGIDVDWSATFAAEQGSTITPGEPLPNGVYQVNGSMGLREGSRTAGFTVTTIEALRYSTECVAGMAAGTADAPFTAGKVHVAVTGDAGRGYAEVTYVACNEASVLYVSR